MQKELFAAAPITAFSETLPQPKTSFLDRHRFTLRLDQTLVLMIGLLVVYVLVFSFGVETGKRYSMAELRAERAKRDRVTEELSHKIFEAQQKMEAAAIPVPPVSAPMAAVPPAPSTSEDQENAKPAGRYTIQAVTVASKVTAARELKKLAGKGHKAFIIPGGKKLQICVDGFESRDEASRMMRQMKGQRLIPADAYVRSIP